MCNYIWSSVAYEGARKIFWFSLKIYILLKKIEYNVFFCLKIYINRPWKFNNIFYFKKYSKKILLNKIILFVSLVFALNNWQTSKKFFFKNNRLRLIWLILVCPSYWWPLSAVSKSVGFFTEIMKGNNIIVIVSNINFILINKSKYCFLFCDFKFIRFLNLNHIRNLFYVTRLSQ